MSSTLRPILLFSATGALATLAISWACAVAASAGSISTFDEEAFYRSGEKPGALGPRDDRPEAPAGLWPKPVPADWPSRPSYHYIADFRATTLDATLDYYSGCKGWWGHGIARLSAGWPLRAMKYELVQADAMPPGWQWGQPMRHQGFVAPLICRGGLPLPTSVAPASRGGDPAWGRLPLAPIPLGFAADAAIFGAAGWGVLLAPRTIRHGLRRRRGQCVNCGYPIGPSPVCPECGKSVMPLSEPGNAPPPIP